MPVEVPLLRTSERSSFKRCRWQWENGYVLCLKPATGAPALRFGSLVHEALRVYYKKGTKRGPHPAITFATLYEAELEARGKMGFREDDDWVDAATLGEGMLNAYVEHYGNDDRWSVLAVEHPFQVPVHHPRTGKLWFYYTGVIDLCVRDRETQFTGLVDHKTTSSDPTKFINQLNLDEQAGAYWRYGRQALYEAGLLRQDKELNGIIFNFLKKKLPDERPQNAEGQCLNKPTKSALVQYVESHNKRTKLLPGKMTVEELTKLIGPKRAAQLGEVSKDQPTPLFFRAQVWRNDAEGERTHARVLEEFREMSLTRRGKMVAYKNPGPLHMPNCAGCGYRDICELHEAGADYEGVRDATMAEWDPYAEHELMEGERS